MNVIQGKIKELHASFLSGGAVRGAAASLPLKYCHITNELRRCEAAKHHPLECSWNAKGRICGCTYSQGKRHYVEFYFIVI